MRLTKKKVLEIAIELWAWLAETGSGKREWEGWEKYGEMENACPFCEYDETHKGGDECPTCPLQATYGGCFKTEYDNWGRARSVEERKLYAGKFLEQLKQL